MAPTAPSAPGKRLTARQKARARLADPLLPRKLHREDNVVVDAFIDSKRDKRLIKHSAFLSRVVASSRSTSSSSSSSVQKKLQQTKRRRPSKKLVATLESLGDALDDIRAEMETEEREGQVMDAEQARQGKMRHRSLKSRPGALKRKERLVKGEMDRFRRSLAQLATIRGASGPGTGAASGTPAVTGGAGGEGGMETEPEPESQAGGTQTSTQAQPGLAATSSRWAALRGFISATMEQNPAFLGKT